MANSGNNAWRQSYEREAAWFARLGDGTNHSATMANSGNNAWRQSYEREAAWFARLGDGTSHSATMARSGNNAWRSMPPPVWLFDLDNTLHDCSRHIFQRIDSNMSDIMMRWLDLDREKADALRLEYWRRYGATAAGLELHHGIAAADFIAAAHDFDVKGLVHAERGLNRKLACLPGRKILLTNAPEAYARAVLRALGIAHHFEMLWSIDDMRLQGRLRCKPSVAMMRQLLARLRVPADRVVLVDDTFANLRSARAVGMRTVLCHHPGTPHNAGHRGRSTYMDQRVNSIGKLLTLRRPCGSSFLPGA